MTWLTEEPISPWARGYKLSRRMATSPPSNENVENESPAHDEREQLVEVTLEDDSGLEDMDEEESL